MHQFPSNYLKLDRFELNVWVDFFWDDSEFGKIVTGSFERYKKLPKLSLDCSETSSNPVFQSSIATLFTSFSWLHETALLNLQEKSVTMTDTSVCLSEHSSAFYWIKKTNHNRTYYPKQQLHESRCSHLLTGFSRLRWILAEWGFKSRRRVISDLLVF